MVDQKIKDAANRHLNLAHGLMSTTELSAKPSEFEVRNAFSRTYYALYHASHAFLWVSKTDVSALGKTHGRLHEAMGRWMGKPFADFLKNSYEFRRKSDYRPEWEHPPLYKVAEEMKRARKQFWFVAGTTRRMLS